MSDNHVTAEQAWAVAHDGHDVGWRHKDGSLYTATCHDCQQFYKRDDEHHVTTAQALASVTGCPNCSALRHRILDAETILTGGHEIDPATTREQAALRILCGWPIVMACRGRRA